MAKKKPGKKPSRTKRTTRPPRKRRTREHVVAAQSMAHVERFIAAAGYTAEAVRSDYGYDILVFTFDGDGNAEEGTVYLQLKATDAIASTAQGITWSVDVRDYRLWTREPMPVFLIVYDARGGTAYWLYVQSYFESDPSRRPKATARTVRVQIPVMNEVDEDFIRYARGRKMDVLQQLVGKVNHHG